MGLKRVRKLLRRLTGLRRRRLTRRVSAHAARDFLKFFILSFLIVCGIVLGLVQMAVSGVFDSGLSIIGLPVGDELLTANSSIRVFLSVVVLAALVLSAGFLFALGKLLLLRPYLDLERAQVRLAQSELAARRLSVVAESASDMVLILDSTGRIEWANTAFYVTTGLTARNVLGRPPLELEGGAFGEDEERRLFLKAVETFAHYEGRLRARTPNGAELELELTMSPSEADRREDRRFTLLLRDVTRLRAYDRRLREAIGLMDDAFAIFDKDGGLILCNEAFQQLAGGAGSVYEGIDIRSLFADLVARSSFELQDQSAGDWAAAEALAMRRPGYERRVKLIDGASFLFRTATLGSGDLVFLGVDVSELAQAQAEAEAAVRSKARILANITHEVRTPMNGVVAMADLLLEGELNEQQRDGLKLIGRSGEQLLGMVDSILDFSKIEAGKMSLSEDVFDLIEVMDDAGRLLAPQAFERGIDMWMRIAEGSHRWLRGDAGRLRQVVLNLLGNAVKFTEAGHVEARLSALRAGDQVEVVLEIEDTGCGIAPEDLQVIFAPYEQSASSYSPQQKGTGLGLSISQQIADLMGGALTAQSVVGEGSVFSFSVSLPAVDGIVSEDQLPASAPVQVVGDSPTVVAVCDKIRAVGGRLTEDPEQAAVTVMIAGPDGTLPELASPPSVEDLVLIISRRISPEIQDMIKVAPEKRRLMYRTIGVTQLALEILNLLGVGLKAQPIVAMKVLIAEDNATNIAILVAMLREEPVLLDIHKTAASALAAFETGRPDIVLMDLNLPDMSGLEATAALRRLEAARGWPRTPVVAATASNDSETRQRAAAADMDDYITKPLSKRELLQALGRARTLPDRRKAM